MRERRGRSSAGRGQAGGGRRLVGERRKGRNALLTGDICGNIRVCPRCTEPSKRICVSLRVVLRWRCWKEAAEDRLSRARSALTLRTERSLVSLWTNTKTIPSSKFPKFPHSEVLPVAFNGACHHKTSIESSGERVFCEHFV